MCNPELFRIFERFLVTDSYMLQYVIVIQCYKIMPNVTALTPHNHHGTCIMISSVLGKHTSNSIEILDRIQPNIP